MAAQDPNPSIGGGVTLVVDAGGWATKAGRSDSEEPSPAYIFSNAGEVPAGDDASARLYESFFDNGDNNASAGQKSGGAGGKSAAGPARLQGVERVLLTESRQFSASASAKAAVVSHIFAAHPDVVGITFAASPFCSLVSTGRADSGLCVDSGWSSTRITPVFGGVIVQGGEKRAAVGGFHVARALAEATGLPVQEAVSMLIAGEGPPLYPDPDAADNSSSTAFTLPNGTTISVDNLVPSVDALCFGDPGICTATRDAIDGCDGAARHIVRDLRNNMVLVGGNTLPDCFTESFTTHFRETAPHHPQAEIFAPAAEFRGFAAWKGAAAISRLTGEWISRQNVEEAGAERAVADHALRNAAWAPWG